MNTGNHSPKKRTKGKGKFQLLLKDLQDKTSLRTKLIVLFLFFFLLLLIIYIAFRQADNTPSPDYPTPDSIAGIPVTEDYLAVSHPNRTNQKRKVKYVVIHETGNDTSGSGARSHNVYIHKNDERTVSWHYTVDDQEIFHHLPDNEVAWHAGDGETLPGGNMSGIGIELCINKDGSFEKTKENGAKLTAYLLNLYELKTKDIKQHADFMDKNCPATIRDNNQWDDFIKEVDTQLKELQKDS